MNETNSDKIVGLEYTGERFMPEISGNIQLEHLHRYLQACEIAKGKIVLDIASGEGYGSAMLAKHAFKVFGVDISGDAVDHARHRYVEQNLQYMVGSCEDIPLPESSVDLVVSFETIEHHNQHEEMMLEIKRVLKPDGVILISSPDKYYYSVEPNYHNPYHVKELYQHEFKSLLCTHFNNVIYFGQKVTFGSGIFAESEETKTKSYFIENQMAVEVTGVLKPLYWIALASNAQLPQLASGVLEQTFADAEIVRSLNDAIGQRDNTIAALNDDLAQKKTEIQELSVQLARQKDELANANKAVSQRMEQVVGFNEVLADRVNQIINLKRALTRSERRIADLNLAVSTRDCFIQQLVGSKSWLLTKPIRWLGRLSRGDLAGARDPFRKVFGSVAEAAPATTITGTVTDYEPTELGTVAVEPAKPSFVALSAYRNKPVPGDPGILRDQAKLLAFYLPQYHRVKENSEWWGPGFTEWTSVAKGRPNFVGHYQPHIPRELGFYDLSSVDIMSEQTELARQYGIHGFCFYYYWFSGRRILERPTDNYLASDIDFPFCLCWANENWTRTWDGNEKDVLLKQGYRDGDEERFIEDLLPFLKDHRYITVEGKPMLLVYRINQLPEPRKSIERWRTAATKAGLAGLHVVVVDFYDIGDPREVGADALVEFPPHKFIGPENNPDSVPTVINPSFAGGISDYLKIVIQSACREIPEFTYYRGIIPGWDNTARRQDTPNILINSSPDRYGAWLRYLRSYNRLAHTASEGSESLIFINAWNEWGEGCHLEPDLRYGLQYLEETARSSWFDAAAVALTLDEARTRLLTELSTVNDAQDEALSALVDNRSLGPSIHAALPR